MPPFTRKELAAATTKRPMASFRVKPIITRFNVALHDVLFGESEPSSRVDLATLYAFVCTARELGYINTGGVIADCTAGLAKSFRRVEDGKKFRLDAASAEGLREMIAAYEMLTESLDERTLMKLYNRTHAIQEIR